MTFTDIVNNVAATLNETSTEGLIRIGVFVNMKHREVCSSVGLSVFDQGTVNATTVPGQRYITFGPGVEKILSVYNTAFTPPLILDEIDYDTMLNEPVITDPALEWAVQNVTDSTVVVMLNSVAGATPTVLTASARLNKSTLSGTMVPKIPEDFQDILFYGARELELEKREKYDLSERQAQHFEKRLAELRYYISSSAYKQIYQGATTSLDTAREVPLIGS